jgi:hypothetical protein
VEKKKLSVRKVSLGKAFEIYENYIGLTWKGLVKYNCIKISYFSDPISAFDF